MSDIEHLTAMNDFRNAPRAERAKRYRLSFVINTVVGGLLLLLALISVGVEIAVPAMRGSLVTGLLPGAIVCLTAGLVHRRKYLSLVG